MNDVMCAPLRMQSEEKSSLDEKYYFIPCEVEFQLLLNPDFFDVI